MNSTNYGKDSTIDPAYVAEFRNMNSGSYEDLVEEIRQIKIKLGQLDNECDKLSNDLSSCNTQIEEINSSIVSLQEQVEALNTIVQGLNQFDCKMDGKTLEFYKE